MKRIFEWIKKNILDFLKMFGIKKYKTASDILDDLGEITYQEPELSYTIDASITLMNLENRYEQLMIDCSLNSINKKVFNERMKLWKKDFEDFRTAYILKLEPELV